ncbi:hypothetical protein [Rhodopirellula bahusiensis]|uniref:hypothetical protein n=1 Tax=Rhodopirellula bahusiensis TaxID=2014065 RepID=UPI0032678DFF
MRNCLVFVFLLFFLNRSAAEERPDVSSLISRADVFESHPTPWAKLLSKQMGPPRMALALTALVDIPELNSCLGKDCLLNFPPKLSNTSRPSIEVLFLLPSGFNQELTHEDARFITSAKNDPCGRRPGNDHALKFECLIVGSVVSPVAIVRTGSSLSSYSYKLATDKRSHSWQEE